MMVSDRSQIANKPLQQIARTDRAPAEWRRWAIKGAIL